MRNQVAEALLRLGWVDGEPIPEEAFRRDQEDRTAQSLRSPNEDRLVRLASAPTHASEVRVIRTEFQRNADVVATVLLAARGHCDLCGAKAPFKRDADGSPYLEVHHILSLSSGGDDTIRNAVALCPNCHREVHYGQNKGRHNKRLQHTAGSRADALLPASAEA
jgi:predicted HNH restriction endonuclease